MNIKTSIKLAIGSMTWSSWELILNTDDRCRIGFFCVEAWAK